MSKLKPHSLGTLRWGRNHTGVLNRAETAQLLRNLKFVVTQEGLDAERRRLGLLNPIHIDIDALQPPESALVTEAIAYAQDLYPDPLLFHCWRAYFFGALIGRHDRVEYDPEQFFLSAILHDIGLTNHAGAKTTCCCFAITGAFYARDWLVERGMDPLDAESVGEAIALHLNLHVPLEERGSLAHLTARGAVCDAFGSGLSRISTDSALQTLARYPRAGIEQFLAPGACEHLAGTRPDLMMKALLNSDNALAAHPLDLPPFVQSADPTSP